MINNERLFVFLLSVFCIVVGFLIGNFPEWYYNLIRPPLSASLEYIWVPDGVETNMISCVNGKVVKQKVDFLISLSVKNLSSEPFEMIDYSVEAKAPDGSWIYVNHVKPADPAHTYIERIFNTPSGLAYYYLDFSKLSFDMKASSGKFKSGEGFGGWIPLCYCNCGSDRKLNFDENTRVRLFISEPKGRRSYVDLRSYFVPEWFEDFRYMTVNPLIEEGCSLD